MPDPITTKGSARKRGSSAFTPYLVAIAGTAAMVLLRWVADPWLGSYLLLTPLLAAVAIAVWHGGWRPAAVSVVVGGLAYNYLFFEPRGTFTIASVGDAVALVLYLITCSIVIGFGEAMRVAQRRDAEGRERLRTTVASIGDAVIAADVEGRVTLMNAVAESLTGWPIADARGKPLRDIFRIVNEQTRKEVENPALRALREGVIIGLANHTVIIARDGTERPIDDSAAPIRCAKGEIVGCVLVFRDITERRHAEKAVRALASIVESSDDAIIGKDINGVITSWNRAAERLFGYSAAEAIGRPITILAPPGRADEMPAVIARLRRGEYVKHFETVRRAKDGRLVPISLTASPIKDDEGQIVGASKIARDISERKRAEAALHEEKERLHATLIGIGDAVIVTDADGRVTMMNRVAQTLTGWKEEAVGRPLEEVFRIVNEETRNTVENPAAKALREGGVVGLANHTVLIARDGTERPIDDSAAPIRTRSGEIVGCVLVFRDITERRKAEEDLRESEARFRRLVEGAPFGMYIVDSQFKIAHMNAGSQTGAFKNVQPVIGRDFSEAMRILWPEDVARQIIKSFRHTLDTGEPYYSKDFINPRADVDAVEGYEWELQRITLPDGQLGVVCYYFDSTVLRRVEQALRESEARLRSILDQLPVGVGVMDPNGQWLLTNSIMEMYVPKGIPAAIPERTPRWQAWDGQGNPISPLDWPGMRALRGETVLPGLEMLFTHDDGRDTWMRISAAPLRGESGRIIGATAVVQDIDLSKRYSAHLEAELARRTAEIELAAKAVAAAQRMAAVGTMASGLAHDMKNVLLPLSIRMDSVLAASGLEGESRTDLTVVVALIDHLRQMARNLELFARDPEQEGSEGMTDLAPWRRRVESLFETSLRGTGQDRALIRLRCDIPDGLPAVAIAPHRLTQVVLNLVHNARDAILAKTGGNETGAGPAGTITIDARAAADKPVVTIRVADDGIGMTEEVHRRCVEPFFTTKDRRASAGPSEDERSGSGIGLALVHAIVQRVSGQMDIESEPGRGCTVNLVLPVAQPAGDGGSASPSATVHVKRRVGPGKAD